MATPSEKPPDYEPPKGDYPPPPPAYGYTDPAYPPTYPPQTSAYPPTYPPQPPGYVTTAYSAPQPPQPPGYAAVVVTAPLNQRLSGAVTRYGQYPAVITCQHCGNDVTTRTELEMGWVPWAAAGGICLMGLWLGCCLIPFCLSSLKNVIHQCPDCRMVVGKYLPFQ